VVVERSRRLASRDCRDAIEDEHASDESGAFRSKDREDQSHGQRCKVKAFTRIDSSGVLRA